MTAFRAELLEYDVTGATHRVQSSTGIPVPHIVERQSKCGRLRLHAPKHVPAGWVRVTIEAAVHLHQHEFAPTPEVRADHALVLQGVVVHSNATKALVSHGGMMLALDGIGLGIDEDEPVRTTLQWGEAA